MKRSKRCPKCDSLRIAHLSMQPDIKDSRRVDGKPAVLGTNPLPRAVGVGPVVDTGFWQHGEVSMLIGSVEAYVCADCGYHETYVVDPDKLDWEQIRGLRWLNASPETQGPYR